MEGVDFLCGKKVTQEKRVSEETTSGELSYNFHFLLHMMP